MGLKADLVAGEVFKLADEVALAAILVHPQLVIAGAEVLVSGVRIG